MEIYKSQIEKNFYHDLFKLTWINQKDVVENHENYDKIIDQICNLESNNILSLSDKRTYLLRKRLGIYDEGKILAQNKISVDMNVGIDYVKKTICQIYNDLSKAVHYNILTPEEYLSDDIDKKLNTHISVFDMLSIREKNALIRSDIYTLSDLTIRNKEDLLRIRNLGDTSIDNIINIIHTLGLKFSDENIEYKKVINKKEVIKVPQNTEKELLIKYNELLKEKEKLQNRVTYLENGINELIQKYSNRKSL